MTKDEAEALTADESEIETETISHPRARNSKRVLRTVRVVIDVAMLALLLFQMGRHLFPSQVHEVTGMLLGACVIAHVALNWRWFAGLARGRWSAYRVFQTLVNVALVVDIVLMLVSGIGMSGLLFDFGTPGAPSRPSQFRGMHMVCVYVALLLFSFHFGMHWRTVMARARKALGAYTASLPMRIALRIVALALLVWGIWQFFDLDLLDYITRKTRFAFIDTSQPLVLYFMNYAAVMAACAVLGHYSVALLTHHRTR